MGLFKEEKTKDSKDAPAPKESLSAAVKYFFDESDQKVLPRSSKKNRSWRTGSELQETLSGNGKASRASCWTPRKSKRFIR